jgi:hypothetical protein
MNVFDPLWSKVTAIKQQIEIGNGGTEEFLVTELVEHLLKGHPPTFRNGKCSHCGVNERRKGGRYCLECHRSYTQVLSSSAKAE